MLRSLVPTFVGYCLPTKAKPCPSSNEDFVIFLLYRYRGENYLHNDYNLAQYRQEVCWGISGQKYFTGYNRGQAPEAIYHYYFTNPDKRQA